MPVHIFHGDKDDFAPIALAEQLAKEAHGRRPIRFETVAGADHFLTDGPAEALIAYLESCIPPEPASWRLPKLSLPAFKWFAPRPLKSGVAPA
jgi:hypothetical protein